MKVTKLIAGFYRVSAEATTYFGIVKKNANEWHADIRNEHGDIVRFAGIWTTKKEAVEEIEFILRRNFV